MTIKTMGESPRLTIKLRCMQSELLLLKCQIVNQRRLSSKPTDKRISSFECLSPIRAAFADREKNCKSLVSGDGSRGGGCSSKGGGGSGGGGDDGSGAGQSTYPLQAFCNSSILLRLEAHFLRK